MFTFRLNLKTKKIYDDMLKLYNEHFNTKFTIASILPYAVEHFLNHGNTNYLKHYNLIKKIIMTRNLCWRKNFIYR